MTIVKRAAAVVSLTLALATGLALAEDPPAPDPSSAAHHKLAAAYNAAHDGVSLLVMVDGKVVFEDYPNGGSATAAHELASGTKSFWGLAAVAAAKDGLLDLDEKVSATITEWKDDPKRGKATIRQLLSLTSGIEGGPIGRPPTYEDALATDWPDEPGARFHYGPAPFQVFGEVLRRKLASRATGGGAAAPASSPLDYLKAKVLDPIGLEHDRWKKGSDGNPHLPSGASLTARQWIKVGELVRQKGAFGDKQVLDPDLLDRCFEGTKANPCYGLTWWLARPIAPELRKSIRLLHQATDLEPGKNGVPDDLAMAAGMGDQRLYVSRSLKLCIVRQTASPLKGLLDRKDRYSDQELLSRLILGKETRSR